MARPKVQTPGENLPPEGDHDSEGGTTDAGAEGGDDSSALKARIEALERENSLLKAATDAKTPTVVVTPVTPHGRAEIAASPFWGMTSAQLMAKIDAGEIAEPPHNTKHLCSDGYYVSRRPEPVK
jgi:hypothetical protein